MNKILNPIEYVNGNIGVDILVVWAELLDSKGKYILRGRKDETVDIVFLGSVYRILKNEKHEVMGTRRILRSM